MKLKSGFLLREVAGQKVVLPTDGALDLNMMITLNDTGAFLWEKLQSPITEEALVDALCAEYEIDRAVALTDVQKFLSIAREQGFLDD